MANPSRDEKIENLVANFSMSMMGMFEGVFSAMAAGLAEAMSGMAELGEWQKTTPRFTE